VVSHRSLVRSWESVPSECYRLVVFVLEAFTSRHCLILRDMRTRVFVDNLPTIRRQLVHGAPTLQRLCVAAQPPRQYDPLQAVEATNRASTKSASRYMGLDVWLGCVIARTLVCRTTLLCSRLSRHVHSLTLQGSRSIGRFEDDFIEERRKGLEEFIIKTANHPQCCTDPGLVKFLTVDDMEVRRVARSLANLDDSLLLVLLVVLVSPRWSLLRSSCNVASEYSLSLVHSRWLARSRLPSVYSLHTRLSLISPCLTLSLSLTRLLSPLFC